MQDYKIPDWLDINTIPKNIEPNQHSNIWAKWSELSLIKKAVQSGNPVVHSRFAYAKINDDEKLINILKEQFDYSLLFKSIELKNSTKVMQSYFVSNDGDIYFYNFEGGDGEVHIYSSDETKVINILKMLKQETTNYNRNKYIHVLVATKDGFGLSKLGTAHQQLMEDNYEDEAIKGYKFAIEQMNSKNPFGRIVILNGDSGTGKSYMVRGLINSIDNALFVVVPPSLLVELSGPSLIKIIADSRGDLEEESPGPIVLICEDADEILQPRGFDNMAHISSLLNFGDGILGNLLDIRIITTTNAKKFKLEKALLRPGRLCKQIDVGNLPPDKANAVYERLTGLKMAFEKDVSLAEVYEKATIKDDKDDSVKKDEQKIGFHQ
jgi:hypothetical protein